MKCAFLHWDIGLAMFLTISTHNVVARLTNITYCNKLSSGYFMYLSKVAFIVLKGYICTLIQYWFQSKFFIHQYNSNWLTLNHLELRKVNGYHHYMESCFFKLFFYSIFKIRVKLTEQNEVKNFKGFMSSDKTFLLYFGSVFFVKEHENEITYNINFIMWNFWNRSRKGTSYLNR